MGLEKKTEKVEEFLEKQLGRERAQCYMVSDLYKPLDMGFAKEIVKYERAYKKEHGNLQRFDLVPFLNESIDDPLPKKGTVWPKIKHGPFDPED